MGTLKTSFCTIAYRKQADVKLATMFEEIARAGYQGAELWWPHVEDLDEAHLKDAAACARDNGLALPIVSPYLGTFNLEMTNRDEMLSRIRAAAPVAVALGAPLLRCFAGWTCECSSLTASPEYWKYNLDGFAEMARIADGHGLDLALETHSETLVDSVNGIRRFVDAGGPRIKVNLQLDDIAANSGLPDGVAVYRELGELVVHAHVPPAFSDDAKRAEHHRLLTAMREDGFQGFVSVESCSGQGEAFEAARQGRALFE